MSYEPLTHELIWAAIDRLAASQGYSTSGLAKRAGLDPTSFNKSKRFTPEGKPRWPSTESISRVLAVANASMEDFINGTVGVEGQTQVPLISLAKARAGSVFDVNGKAAGHEWQKIAPPFFRLDHKQDIYALHIEDGSHAPVYAPDTILLVSPDEKIKPPSRIVLATNKTIHLADLLGTGETVAFLSLENGKIHSVPANEVLWISRILWASQ